MIPAGAASGAAHKPYCREAGTGPRLLCLHANASSSSQWRALMDLLAPRYRVIAPDLYGAGKSPDWPCATEITLDDEAALIQPLLEAADDPVVLAGHSHGAAVALLAALRNPGRVRALVLYEPTLFALIDAHSPPPNDADGIRHAVAEAAAALAAGRNDAAAQCFIDYWMGPGAWQGMPPERQGPVAAAVRNVRRWAFALFNEPTPLERFRELDMPVLYMTGKRSTASALGVARILAPALPRAELVEFDDLGHMGPVTHAPRVNAAIERFLAALDRARA